jgi:hypothetical protein
VRAVRVTAFAAWDDFAARGRCWTGPRRNPNQRYCGDIRAEVSIEKRSNRGPYHQYSASGFGDGSDYPWSRLDRLQYTRTLSKFPKTLSHIRHELKSKVFEVELQAPRSSSQKYSRLSWSRIRTNEAGTGVAEAGSGEASQNRRNLDIHETNTQSTEYHRGLVLRNDREVIYRYIEHPSLNDPQCYSTLYL